MKSSVKAVVLKSDNALGLREVELNSISLQYPSIIAIDGSTTNTGVAILRKEDGAVSYVLSFEREKNKDESPVRYKIELKKAILNILLRNRIIDTIYYEEPFIGYATAAPNLMMLRTFVEELIIENEPQFNYLEHKEINNKKWKKLFLAPDKCPSDSSLEKEAVKKKLISQLPFMKTVTQDEIDATAMGFIATVMLSKGLGEDLESKKKVRPFQYNIKFMGADEDDIALQEFYDVYTGPQSLLGEGISFIEISGTANFDKKIYETMGSIDKVIIAKFSSNHHGNLILQYKIGHLASVYSYIYAIVWRKSRKT